MTLADITREAVLAAMAEFDRLGRDEFLAEYEFGPALSYFVVHDGKEYDSRAIVGYAHGEIPGQRRWTTDDSFSGGEASVARLLRDHLGFSTVIRRNFDWTRDEVILAVDLVWANDWHELRAGYPEVVELSKLLRRYWVHPVAERTDKFRSPNSVSRKTSDIATAHPAYSIDGRERTRGSKLDRQVVDEFLANPEEMHRQAQAIRTVILAGAVTEDSVDDVTDPDLDGASVVADLAVADPGTTLDRAKRSTAQSGRQSDPFQRKAVERHAVNVVTIYLQGGKWEVTDVGGYEPWDLTATRDGEELHVEVKGSTGTRDAVDLTDGEVRHAERYSTLLAVVDEIKMDEALNCTGGRLRLWNEWVPDRADLTATAYRYLLPGSGTEVEPLA